MKRAASDLPVWRWTTLCLFVAAACVLTLHYAVLPSLAQEKVYTSEKPDQSQTKPAEQPAAQSPQPAPAVSEPAPKAQQAEPATEKKPEAETKETAKEPEKKEAPKEAEALDNQSCYECHNPDILKMSKEDLEGNVNVGEKPQPPRTKPAFVLGELSLSIDKEKFDAGVHSGSTCVECHKEISELPHDQRLKAVDCAQCHEEFVEDIKDSAHGEKAGPKALACTGCHDVHYGKGKDEYAEAFKMKVCADCHKAYGMDTAKAHSKLYEYQMHAKMGCLICHKGDKPGVHNIPKVKTKVATCDSCHSKYTVLAKEKPKPVSLMEYVKQIGFINKDVKQKYGYVLGANRIPALDTIIILAVIAPLGLPIVHGGLRILTRRKGPIDLPEEKILLHPFIERLWHWFQALCIVMLIITGIMLHWPEKFGGWFNWAVSIHNWFGWAAVVAFLVWLFYNLGTKRIKHYIPKKGDIPGRMIVQAKFYGFGIFMHEPHPYAPSEDDKFNPLQKIAYLQFQVMLLPILLITGLLYMYPETFGGIIRAMGGLTVLATVHYILGALFAAFLVAHLYLATTGETIGENFKAIIFGYGIKAEHGEHKEV